MRSINKQISTLTCLLTCSGLTEKNLALLVGCNLRAGFSFRASVYNYSPRVKTQSAGTNLGQLFFQFRCNVPALARSRMSVHCRQRRQSLSRSRDEFRSSSPPADHTPNAIVADLSPQCLHGRVVSESGFNAKSHEFESTRRRNK